MEPRTLHLAGHEDPVADVGREVSSRVSHISALLQQLALRGRFTAAGFPLPSLDSPSIDPIAQVSELCARCSARPCQCSLDTRERLKSQFLDHQDERTDQPPSLVSADVLQSDALDVWDHEQRQRWAEQLRRDLAPSAAVATEILTDTSADNTAVLSAARIVVWDAQLAADAARHSEVVVQAADRWRELNAVDRWAQYLPGTGELDAHTEKLRDSWLSEQMGELVPALQRGDTVGSLSGVHESLDAGLRDVAHAHGVRRRDDGYYRGEAPLESDTAAQEVEADVDDRVADIASWQQRERAQDRNPDTIPGPANDGAVAKARQTKAHTRLIDSDGDVKEAAAHEASDPRAPQPIRPVANHLTDPAVADLALTDPLKRR